MSSDMKARWTKLKSSAAGLTAWTIVVCLGIIILPGSQYREMYTVRERFPRAVAVLVLTLTGHELIHALTVSILCRCRVAIRAGKDPLGIPALCSVFPKDIGA